MNSCINCLVLTLLFNPSLRRLKDVKTMCGYYYCYCLNTMSQHMSQSSYFTHNTSQRRLLNVQKTSCNHRNSFKNVDDVKLQLFQHITRVKKTNDVPETSNNVFKRSLEHLCCRLQSLLYYIHHIQQQQ